MLRKGKLAPEQLGDAVAFASRILIRETASRKRRWGHYHPPARICYTGVVRIC